MKRKSKHLESPKRVNIIKVTPKRKFKDLCSACNTYKEDVHSYFDAKNNVYLLCPDCMKQNKSLIRNWKNEPIEREVEHDKDEGSKKKRTKKSEGKNNKNSSNTENGSKDSGQLSKNLGKVLTKRNLI